MTRKKSTYFCLIAHDLIVLYELTVFLLLILTLLHLLSSPFSIFPTTVSPEEKAVSTEKKLKRPVYYVSICLNDADKATEMPDPSTDEPPPQKKAKISHGHGRSAQLSNIINTLAKKLFDNQNRATVEQVHPRATEDEVNEVLKLL